MKKHLNMELSILLIVLALASYDCSCDGHVSPDKIMLGNIALGIWTRRQEVVSEAVDRFGLVEEDIQEALLDIERDTDDAKQSYDYNDCPVCVAFIAAIQGFINQSLTFEDVRDFAVDVCKDVNTEDGDIICEGTVDVFGPHVFYVLNETDMEAREICEFHKSCPESLLWQSSPPSSYPVRKTSAPHNKPARPRASRKQVLKLAHITDVHLDENYAVGSPDTCVLPICCRDYWPGSGSAGPWGSYGCALPLHTLDLVMNFISDLDVDMVLYTGDSPNHALWEETLEGQIWQNEILANSIKTNLPGVPAHVCVGNHDTYPGNQFYGPSPYTKDLLHHMRLMFQDLANFTEEQAETFQEAGNYVSEVFPGLKILSYNSNYGYIDNFYGVLIEDSPDWVNTVSFMEEQFDTARENGEKIILLGHHPMGVDSFRFWHDFINDIMMRNGDLVILHLIGHDHKDFYKMALDSENNAVHVNQVTGSLMTTRNPSFKIFYLDTDTLMPTHFDNYFINISKTLDGETPAEIELMYNSAVDYGMPDLTASSYQNFTDRQQYNCVKPCRMEGDDELLALFRWNEYSRQSDCGPCDEACKQKFFCTRRSTSEDVYNACMET